MPLEYQAQCFGRALGPWRDMSEQASEDAEAAGEGERTTYANGSKSIIYLKVGTEIVQRTKLMGNMWPAHKTEPQFAYLDVHSDILQRRGVRRLMNDGQTKLQAWQYQRAVPVDTMARRALIKGKRMWAIYQNEVEATEDEIRRIISALRITVDDWNLVDA